MNIALVQSYDYLEHFTYNKLNITMLQHLATAFTYTTKFSLHVLLYIKILNKQMGFEAFLNISIFTCSLRLLVFSVFCDKKTKILSSQIHL